ncbi:TetR/AcrR family transcriptional regulator [Microbispora sp. H10830]|uniref:TetR/AcrR family transcriptional regulator n=1 Tax=Microbispora sp. H10830 TaxID=2729109 RepID=UPI001600E719|nr:TetR/AcrR family transcriptional regulator [Microbispora sp. H10830]
MTGIVISVTAAAEGGTVTDLDSRPAGPASTGSRERERAERILDAAGELLVAWGYPRITVEDVARRAGVGKGTVYLHFSTKELLFLAVLIRAKARIIERLAAGVRADPSAVLLSSAARSAYLWVHEEPIFRATLLGDDDTLGALSRSAAENLPDLLDVRDHALLAHVEVLREHGLVRTDQSSALQVHAYESILTGFVTIEPLSPSTVPALEDNADMIAHVIRAAFELPGSPESVRAAAPRVSAIYQRLLDRLNSAVPTAREIHRHKRT